MSQEEQSTKGKVKLSREDQYAMALEKAKWENRRRMAWLASIMYYIATGYLMGFQTIEEIQALGTVYSWLTGFCMSTVGAYIGFSTYYAVKSGN